MKIKVNSKSFEFGKASDRTSCKVSFESACELSGIAPRDVAEITWKHKTGESGILKAGIKLIAYDGTAIIVKQREESKE
ncbi:MAG: hypothetical protein E6Q97_01050 [Desulfurellales bacterium]|nr:MAG: hypothetical protein E6Q97_01050 [Desulfurellales bacterium]